MPFLPPPPRPGSQGFDAARAVDKRAKAIEQQATLGKDDDGISEVSRKGGLARAPPQDLWAAFLGRASTRCRDL